MQFITDSNEFKMNPLQEFVYHLLSFVYLCFISRGLEQQEKPWPCRSENVEEEREGKLKRRGKGHGYVLTARSKPHFTR